MVEDTAPIEGEEPVASTETDESEPKTEQTVAETEPDEETPEKVYTKAEVDEIMTKRVAREKRRLQREFEEKQTKVEPQKVEKPAGEPKLEDFETTEEWLDARTDWRFEQRQQQEDDKSRAEADKKALEKTTKDFNRKADKFEQTHPDFWDAMDNIKSFEIPAYLNEAVMTSDLSAELAYHLAQHSDELEHILDLQPAAAVRALGRLEVKLEKQPTSKEISKVPAPIKPLKGGSREDNAEYKAGDTYEQFMKVRNLEMGRGKKVK